MLGIRRRGFSVTKQPSAATLYHGGHRATLIDISSGGSAYLYGPNRDYDPGPVTDYAIASKTDPGAGTESNPFNPTQAANITVSGAKKHIEWLDGVGTVTSTASRWRPLFEPLNSGTSSFRIVHRARNPGMVEFRHTAGDGLWSFTEGAPAFGISDVSYAIIDGFKCDASVCEYRQDTGHGILHNGTNIELHRCVIIGETVPMTSAPGGNDNYNGIRVEEVTNPVIRNCTISGIRSTQASGMHNRAAIMTYSAPGLVFDNNDISDSCCAFFIKGIQSASNSGSIGFNKIHGVDQALEIQAVRFPATLDIHHNLVYDSTGTVVQFRSTGPTTDTSGISLRYNTFARLGAGYSNTSDYAVIELFPAIDHATFAIVGNIVVMDGKTNTRYFIGSTTLPGSMDRNLYFNNGVANRWDGLGTTYGSLLDWQNASGRDTNSIVANPQFTDADNDDFTLAPGSAARILDAGGSPIGCYGSSGASQYVGLEQ